MSVCGDLQLVSYLAVSRYAIFTTEYAECTLHTGKIAKVHARADPSAVMRIVFFLQSLCN